MIPRRWVLLAAVAAIGSGLAIAWLIHPVPAAAPAPSPQPHASMTIAPPTVTAMPSPALAEPPVPRRAQPRAVRRVMPPVPASGTDTVTVTTTNSW